MENDFWHRCWLEEDLGFHQPKVNRLLSQAWNRLGLAYEARVLVPLCGKSLDLLWFHEYGHPVVGVELSKVAVDALVEEHGLAVERQPEPWGERLRGKGVDLLVGDFFALDRAAVGEVNAVYDRAALVAMPRSRRPRYAEQLRTLAGPRAVMLIIVFDYAVGALEGPPFALTMTEMLELFPRRDIHALAQRKIEIKGQPVREIALYVGPEGS